VAPLFFYCGLDPFSVRPKVGSDRHTPSPIVLIGARLTVTLFIVQGLVSIGLQRSLGNSSVSPSTRRHRSTMCNASEVNQTPQKRQQDPGYGNAGIGTS